MREGGVEKIDSFEQINSSGEEVTSTEAVFSCSTHSVAPPIITPRDV